MSSLDFSFGKEFDDDGDNDRVILSVWTESCVAVYLKAVESRKHVGGRY